jgi:hypothetical protein
VYGYKHSKSLKFYAQLLRCLKDCYEMKFEQLNIDMNFFLLLKNELSLHFLRQTENIVQTVKLALRVYASEDEKNRLSEESHELRMIEKIMKGLPTEIESEDDEEEKKSQEESEEEMTPLTTLADEKTIF